MLHVPVNESAMWMLSLIAGVKVMFRIALVLFKHVLSRSEQLAECPSMYETMEKLRRIPSAYMQEEFLVLEVRPSRFVLRNHVLPV